MIDEARVLARKLRSAYGYSPATNRAAAQCLEKLAALVESEKRKSGLLSMLTSAESAAETYKRERDAAVHELSGLCRLCKHWDKENRFESEKCRSCTKDHNWEWCGPKEGQHDAD